MQEHEGGHESRSVCAGTDGHKGQGDRGQCFVPTEGHLGRSTGAPRCVGTDCRMATGPPTVFAVEARGRQRCGIIYLFAEARSGEGGPRPGQGLWAAAGSHRPLAQAVSQWSCMLLKPDLARAPQGSSLPEIVPRLRAKSEPPAAGPGLGWL